MARRRYKRPGPWDAHAQPDHPHSGVDLKLPQAAGSGAAVV